VAGMTAYSPSRLGWFELHAVDHCNQSCVHCLASSPFFKRREYQASEYFPWIDEMVRRGISFDRIGVIGGEPFLHSDLTGFVRQLRERYPFATFALTTNGFWLSDEAIDRYRPLFRSVAALHVTLYPNLVARQGRDEVDRLIGRLRAEFPALAVEVREGDFLRCDFSRAADPPTRYCSAQAGCTNLRADGLLYRCSVGAYAHANPTATPEFLAARAHGLVYDLGVNDGADFASWLSRWPLEACSFCNVWREQWEPWINDPGIRRPDGMNKYLPIVQLTGS
jgi:hypothetical protein